MKLRFFYCIRIALEILDKSQLFRLQSSKQSLIPNPLNVKTKGRAVLRP